MPKRGKVSFLAFRRPFSDSSSSGRKDQDWARVNSNSARQVRLGGPGEARFGLRETCTCRITTYGPQATLASHKAISSGSGRARPELQSGDCTQLLLLDSRKHGMIREFPGQCDAMQSIQSQVL